MSLKNRTVGFVGVDEIQQDSSIVVEPVTSTSRTVAFGFSEFSITPVLKQLLETVSSTLNAIVIHLPLSDDFRVVYDVLNFSDSFFA